MTLRDAMEIKRLAAHEGLRLRTIRLRALADAPDAFASTHDEAAARPLDSWAAQLHNIATFVAVLDGEDVGLVRGARDDSQADAVVEGARAGGARRVYPRAWACTWHAICLLVKCFRLSILCVWMAHHPRSSWTRSACSLRSAGAACR